MALKVAYNFDTVTGSNFNQFTDYSGNFNVGQATGNANTNPGAPGRRWYRKVNFAESDFCLQGTGAGNRIASAYGPIITSGTTGFTMSFDFWYPAANATSMNGDLNLASIFIDSGTDQDRGGIYLYTDAKIGCWFTTSAGSSGGTCNDRPNPGAWNNVALVWNGATLKIWINGRERGETWNLGGTINWTISHIDLGGVEAWGGFTGERKIDNFRVYDHALTPGEILRDSLVPVGYTQPVGGPKLPEYKSSNGRYFVDPNGSTTSEGDPIFYNILSAWGAFTDIPSTQWDAFLQSIAADGYNAIYVQICPGGTPTQAGNMPFTDASLTPNEPYWVEADAFIQKCYENGILVMAHIVSAWDTADWNVFTTATDFDNLMFGQFLQNRYPSSNVWLFAGGDWGVPHSSATLVQRVSNIMDGSPDKWWFFHHQEETTGLEDPTLGPKADIAATYSYQPTYLMTRAGYASNKPSFFVEGNYEFENNNHPAYLTTKETLRRQDGWALTNGQFGIGKGTGYVWNFQLTNEGWMGRMLTEGDQQRQFILKKYLKTKWWSLVPDLNGTFITAGAGTKLTSLPNADVRSNDYATSAISADKSLAWTYIPVGNKTVTFDLTKLGTSITARIIDPTGTIADTVISGLANTGTTTITAAQLPVHSGATDTDDKTTSDYYIQWTATAVNPTPTGRPRYIARGGALVATTRYLVRGGSLVAVTN